MLSQDFLTNASRFEKRLNRIVSIFKTLMEYGQKEESYVLYLNETPYFDEIIQNFGPCLESAKVDLRAIYDVAFHVKTGSIIVANRGLTLLSLSPTTSTSYITRGSPARSIIQIWVSNLSISASSEIFIKKMSS